MRYPHQCGQLHGYPNEITMANGAAWRQFVVARRAKSVIHQKFHRQLFGRPQTPTRLLRVARFSKKGGRSRGRCYSHLHGIEFRAGHANEALGYLDRQKHYASVALRVAGR